MNLQTNRQQGSGVFVVLIIATALGIGVYSTLDLVSGEFQRNKKAYAHHEAKLAAESLLQASMADLRSRFENQSAFPIDSLSPTNNPLYISDEFANRYLADDARSRLVIPSKRKYSSKADFNSQVTEVIGGQIPPGRWQYIDPRIPGNQFDELAGTLVFERSIEMISKATVEDPNLGQSTVYARQFLQVRDAPLFAYAIFYNIPMEIAPGPKMEVFGNVHSNGDSWFQASSGLDLHSKVTLAGEMQHGRHPDSGKSDSYGAVRIKNANGSFVNMKKDGSWPSESASEFDDSWMNSGADNFTNIADQIWDGNVQTGDHGVLPQNPVGVTDYIEDTNPSTDRKESFNSAYSMIQPVLDKDALSIPKKGDDPEGHAAAKRLNEVERQKYAYKAGLTIEVADDGDLSYYTYSRKSNGDLKYEDDGSPKKVQLQPSEPIASFSGSYTESGDEVTAGMYEKRQAKELRTVELDVGALKDLVHANDRNNWKDSKPKKKHAPDSWWNGVVYVDFPTQNSSSSRPDNVNPAKEGWGLKVVNGGTIPNPAFAHSEGNYGMSLATNQMMYVEGNYNADGDRSTGSPTTPDNASNFAKEGHEAPAALIADSVTFQSNSWDDSDSARSMSHRVASDTEVSAAVLTGLVPSGESGSNSYSGGVENFPRFLENWKGKSMRIRGSMVALFESEVGTRRWGYSDVYSPPNRDWGFHSKFAEGYLPPGTPNTRRYRGIDFQLINEAEYASHVARIKTYY